MNRDRSERRAQLLYARWLEIATRAAFVLTVAAFAAYAGGLLPALVPFDALPGLWGLPAEEFQRRSGAPPGLGWLGHLDRGEYLSLASIALLPLVSLACYLRLALACAARRERLQAALALAQVMVLAVAASGYWH